ARPSSWPDRRPFPISAAGPGHGADRHDRRGRGGDDHRGQRQQPVRRAPAGADEDARGSAVGRGIDARGGPNPFPPPRADNVPLPTSPPVPAAPAATRAGTADTTQVVLAFDDNRLASLLFGQYGQNLALIERRLGVVADQRGNHVTVAGSRDGVERARRGPQGLFEPLQRGDGVVSRGGGGAVRL